MSGFGKVLKLYTHFILVSICVYLLSNRNVTVIKTHKTYDRFLHDMRHVLLWNDIEDLEGEGQDPFLKKKCKHYNCFVTKNTSLLGDTKIFDAIVFNSEGLNARDLPKHRSKEQKFIFFSKQSSDTNLICDKKYDRFFNWTWTYRTDSEVKMRFYSILNLFGDNIGSSAYFKWLKKMDPISRVVRESLISKRKAAAWFVDECATVGRREEFVRKLQSSLSNYNLTVDIFGKCGHMKCKRKTMKACHWKLKHTYYFYLALEDSFDKDFVTDHIVHALKNNAVPIVYGGADYTKFLPPGSYLDGWKLGAEGLARAMHQAIVNKNVYYDFFKWKNHYVIKENRNIVDVCDLCQKLNSIQYLKFHINYPEFRGWWNPGYRYRCDDAQNKLTYFR